MSRDSFEVYYHQNGRWQLHASYEATQREMAIEDAKTVEQKEGYPTRVLRESFDPDTNTTEAAITFQSHKAKAINDADNMFGTASGGGKSGQKGGLKKQASAPRPAPPRAAPPAAAQQQQRSAQQKSASAQPAQVRAPQKKGKKKKPRGVLMRLVMVVGTSTAIALLSAAGLLAFLYALIQFGTLDANTNRAPLVGGILVLSFFFSLFVNLQKQFKILSFLKGQPSAQKRVAGAEAMMAAVAKKSKRTQEVEFDQVSIEDMRESIAAEDGLEEDGALETPALDDEAPPSLDADMGAEAGIDMGADTGVDMGAEVHETPAHSEQQPQPAQQAPTVPEQKAAPAPSAAPQTPPAEVEARAAFTRFVGDVVRHTSGDINAFTRFGLNLYVAGAGSVMGQAKRLPRDAQLGVVKQGLQASGMPADRAEAFCVELPSHGKNPKYAGMIQAGVKAMQDYLGGNAAITGQISNLLQEWNLPEKRAAIPTTFTFVFTDIVGSTAMTQRLGNAGAQKAVRAHNTAVRGAIQAYKGREVKHTGDGIMATFPDPPSAVAACIKIQREIFAHNSANPTVDVHLRIGINAGEAVEEDNDFFGAAVQMTARICDKASKDNIWVSQAVLDACKGQKYGFIPRGAFEMKGIQGSKRLFEVGWSDAHKNELADI